MKFTRWTLIVAVIGMILGGVAVQILLPLNGAQAGIDDTLIGAAFSMFAGIAGHYFPKG